MVVIKVHHLGLGESGLDRLFRLREVVPLCLDFAFQSTNSLVKRLDRGHAHAQSIDRVDEPLAVSESERLREVLRHRSQMTNRLIIETVRPRADGEGCQPIEDLCSALRHGIAAPQPLSTSRFSPGPS
jgi:hypothetical protein